MVVQELKLNNFKKYLVHFHSQMHNQTAIYLLIQKYRFKLFQGCFRWDEVFPLLSEPKLDKIVPTTSFMLFRI